MKTIAPFVLLLLALSFTGCSVFRHHPSTAVRTITRKPVITPDQTLAARIVRVNAVARFVLLNFPDGAMPKVDQTLFAYRAGLKVAELKVTGPQQDNYTVADITSGDPQVGDTVRSD